MPKSKCPWTPDQIRSFIRQVKERYEGFWERVGSDVQDALVCQKAMSVLGSNYRCNLTEEELRDFMIEMNHEAGLISDEEYNQYVS